jgi:hypothetical protein
MPLKRLIPSRLCALWTCWTSFFGAHYRDMWKEDSLLTWSNQQATTQPPPPIKSKIQRTRYLLFKSFILGLFASWFEWKCFVFLWDEDKEPSWNLLTVQKLSIDSPPNKRESGYDQTKKLRLQFYSLTFEIGVFIALPRAKTFWDTTWTQNPFVGDSWRPSCNSTRPN